MTARVRHETPPDAIAINRNRRDGPLSCAPPPYGLRCQHIPSAATAALERQISTVGEQRVYSGVLGRVAADRAWRITCATGPRACWGIQHLQNADLSFYPIQPAGLPVLT